MVGKQARSDGSGCMGSGSARMRKKRDNSKAGGGGRIFAMSFECRGGVPKIGGQECCPFSLALNRNYPPAHGHL